MKQREPTLFNQDKASQLVTSQIHHQRVHITTNLNNFPYLLLPFVEIFKIEIGKESENIYEEI